MVAFFRRLLIRFGKILPFVLAFIFAIGYIENIFAIVNNNVIVGTEGEVVYNTPISFFLAEFVYVDWFDVLLLYVLAFALEFCKYNMRAVHYLFMNLAIRSLVERFYIENGIVIGICAFVALCGLYCAYGGLKVLTNKQ